MTTHSVELFAAYDYKFSGTLCSCSVTIVPLCRSPSEGQSKASSAFRAGSSGLHTGSSPAFGADPEWGHCSSALQHHLRHLAQQEASLVRYVPGH